MTTYSVNEVMAEIGYTASPDNEESLLAYLHEAKIIGLLAADFSPFDGTILDDDGAYQGGGAHRITEEGRDKIVELFGDDPEGTFVPAWNAWNQKRLETPQPLTPASKDRVAMEERKIEAWTGPVDGDVSTMIGALIQAADGSIKQIDDRLLEALGGR